MEDGAPPSERQAEELVEAGTERPVERRAAPRSRAASAGPRERRDGNGNGTEPVPERRKSPPRQRKPATASAATIVGSDVAVADRIDPLLAASSAALDQAEALATAKPVRRRPPARKPTPVTAEAVEVEPTTTDLAIIDDFFAEPAVELSVEPRVAEPPAESRVVEPPATERIEALVPYVLPKIIPGEPDTEPDAAPETESILTKVVARLPYKPQFRGVTERLKRTLQPVVLPRHRPRVRRVTRVVRHIDTWSVFKIAVLFNIFLYAVCLAAGAMLWRVALNTGTIENIERFFESFGWQTFELKGGEIYHNAWIIGLFGVVGLTGLAVLAATMFNLITDLVGGVRVTVLEEEVVAREQRVVSWPRLLRPASPPGGKPPSERPSEPSTD